MRKAQVNWEEIDSFRIDVMKAYFRQCCWHCLKTLRVCVRKHRLLTCALPRTNSAASKIDILFGCRILRNDKRLEDGSA